MKTKELNICPGTLAEGHSSYSPACIKKVFDGRTVSHILPFSLSASDDKLAELFLENRKRISLSGVQEKISLILDKRGLRLTQKEEQGTHILKPIPRDLKNVNQVPVNEHLTMQIASQVYNIITAENALVFFENGAPAYITKRFDIERDGRKRGKEDFATLAGKTSDNAGPDFKYDYSYEEMAGLIRRFVPSWRVEMEKFYSLVLFNYLFSNGDAHLKNFSLLESSFGDYILSPAYDLVNTRLHVSDMDFALNRGLFQDNFRSTFFKRKGHPGKADFIEFGHRIGITGNRIDKLLAPFQLRQPLVEVLLNRSFLNESVKKGYLLRYNTKRNYLAG